MSPADSTVPEDGSRLRTATYWAAPLAVLFALWLWLAFSSGGYLPRQWLPAGLVLGLFGLVVAVFIAYPRRPRQLSLAVLTLFGLFAVWVAFSALWADSVTRVWLEAARTFGFLLVFALALLYLTDPRARRVFRYLVMGAAFVLLAACVWRLWSTGNIAGLFNDNRLYYPLSYPNNAATLFLVAFWPLMWLAAGKEERAPVRGIALGLATGLLGLTIMTQSRGAMWSMAITLVLAFIVTPIRLRTLFYLLVPALLMVYAFPHLNRYWLEGPEAVGGAVAARSLSGGIDHRRLHRNDRGLTRTLGEGQQEDEGRLRHRDPGGGGGVGRIRFCNAHQRRGRPLRMGLSELGAVHQRSGPGGALDSRLRGGLPLCRDLLERADRHLESRLAGVPVVSCSGGGSRQLGVPVRPPAGAGAGQIAAGPFPRAAGAGRDRDRGRSLRIRRSTVGYGRAAVATMHGGMARGAGDVAQTPKDRRGFRGEPALM